MNIHHAFVSGLGNMTNTSLAKLCFIAGIIHTSVTASPAVCQRPTTNDAVLIADIGADTSRTRFHYIGGVAITDVGDIAVLDHLDHRVRIYSLHGALKRSFGRQGSGPGEFTTGLMLLKRPGEFVIVDGSDGRFVRFDLEGRHIDTRQHLIKLNIARRIYNTWLPMRNGLLLVTGGPLFGNTDNHAVDYTRVLALADTSGTLLSNLFTFRSGLATYRKKGEERFVNGAPPFFAAGGAWGLRGDSLLVTVNGYTGRVTFLKESNRSFESIGVVELGWSPVSIDAQRETRARQDSLVRRHGGRPQDYEIFLPQYRGRVQVVVLDDAGRAWIREVDVRTGKPNGNWYVVSVTGNIAQVRFDPAFEIKDVAGSLVAGVVIGVDGVQTVRVYRRAFP